MADAVRTRIPPSPTGNLHVGTARTALFNWLFAKKHKGQFIVRSEDTDKQRSKKEFEENILEGMKWLGLTWDEGPDVGGPHAPYRQSERTQRYTQALEQLLSEDKAYYEDNAVRLRVAPQEVSFHDEVRGDIRVHTDNFGGDVVIARSLDDALYHLAVVVDDRDMQITHVIRGEDHLHNTAKHILIQRALGYQQPIYAHLPLLLDEKRAKLSKRAGEISLLAYRDAGYLPEAMVNYLALLGWNPGTDREYFTLPELTDTFSLEGVQKGGAIFSMEKLTSINKHYIRSLENADFFERTKPFLEQEAIDVKKHAALLEGALATEQERIATLKDVPAAVSFFLPSWNGEYEAELLIWKKSDKKTTSELLEKLIAKIKEIPEDSFSEELLEKTVLSWIDQERLGRGDTLWPMRVALTGREHSPGPFEVAAVLGKDATQSRLTVAHKKLM